MRGCASRGRSAQTQSAHLTNVDYAPTFLDLAGVEVPDWMQGRSFAPLLDGNEPADWPTSMYYRYWMHRDSAHNVWAHHGVRTERHKLIYFYNDPSAQPGAHGPVDPPEWELYDLVNDPDELVNVFGQPGYEEITVALQEELARMQALVGDEPHPSQGRS